MTLIIGMKCKDSIVLIGDRKIMDDNAGKHHFVDKIEAPVSGVNVAAGAAGFTDLAREFNRRIVNVVADRINEYRMSNIRSLNGTGVDITDIESKKVTDIVLPAVYRAENFLDDCAVLVAQLAQSAFKLSTNPIEALVAIHTDKGVLYQINCDGFKREGSVFGIGSGFGHIEKYLMNLYKESMSLDEVVKLGVFLIKYVELLELDSKVGTGKKFLPQIFIVNKDGSKEHVLAKADEESISKNVQEKINKIIEILS
jgi:20S proteasome alpha/beta subunit